MSGIGPAGAPIEPNRLRGVQKDGSGGSGGTGYFRREQKQQEERDDEANFSEEALQKMKELQEESSSTMKRPEHIKLQDAAAAEPESDDARLEILSEINHFNEMHQRNGSAMKAVIKPLAGKSILHIEDRRQGVDVKPFGGADVFHQSVPSVRTKLEAFDHSAGSLFDGKI